MKAHTCPYCDDTCSALYTVADEWGNTTLVCWDCRESYNEWLRAEQVSAHAVDYDGPVYADTMSGGCILVTS